MKTEKRKQLLWWVGLFVTPETGLIPTTYRTDAGFHLQREPITEFDYRNRVALAESLREAIARGNPHIQTPSQEEQKKRLPDVQKRMKAKTWKEVERRSIYFSIECLDDEFVVISWGRAPDGTWAPEKERALERHIPVSEGIDAIVDAIWEHLTQRSDLPGLPIARTT
ncbi:MAG TPA: hypothetical protein V6D08_15610 [Candidatus Obscuribacterales bacterium]